MVLSEKEYGQTFFTAPCSELRPKIFEPPCRKVMVFPFFLVPNSFFPL